MVQASRRKRRAVAVQAAELSAAVPQVVFHRITRLALAGIQPKPGDGAELRRMGVEKIEAWQESWLGMMQQTWVMHQEWLTAVCQSAWAPWIGGGQTPLRLHRQLTDSAVDVVREGLAPVHRRAVANARRLSRARSR